MMSKHFTTVVGGSSIAERSSVELFCLKFLSTTFRAAAAAEPLALFSSAFFSSLAACLEISFFSWAVNNAHSAAGIDGGLLGP